MSTTKSYFKYIFSVLLFGLNGIVASHISLNSYEIVLLRTLIGSLFLIAVFLLTKQKLTFTRNKKHFWFLMLSGISMGASWMFLYEAYKQIGVSLASLAYYCGPVIVMVLSPVLFGERLIWQKIAGFLVVLLGIFLVNMNMALSNGSLWGLFCGIMSALTYSSMVICNKKAESIKGLENSMLQLIISFITVAIFVGMKQGLALEISRNEWIPILVLGVINTGVGCYMYFSSIGYLPVQTVAVCGYLELVSAVIFSMLFLGEAMTALQAVGAFLVVGGAIFGELSGLKRIAS